MDESHRLKPMVEDYDQSLFLSLFKQTEKLRNSLVKDINPHKFGVDSEELKSWFETKFIYAFNKYYHDERCCNNRPEKLKAFIINSLMTYKYRIIKNSYLNKQAIHQTVDIEEVFDYENLIIDNPLIKENQLFEKANSYLKARLSRDAYLLLTTELNLPPYILSRITTPDQKKIPKCSAGILAEYLGIDDINYINTLRKEINLMIRQAKEYFQFIQEAS